MPQPLKDRMVHKLNCDRMHFYCTMNRIIEHLVINPFAPFLNKVKQKEPLLSVNYTYFLQHAPEVCIVLGG